LPDPDDRESRLVSVLWIAAGRAQQDPDVEAGW
jgi:hypothetical protein